VTAGRVLMVALLLCSAVVVQTVILSRLPLPGATPDLVLLVVVALALVQGSNAGAVIGFAGGLLLDVVPPADDQVGRWALVLCLVGWFAGRATDAAESSAFVPLLVVAAASVGSLLAFAAVGFALGDVRVSAGDVLGALPAALLYDVVLAPFVVPPVMRLARRFEPSSTYARTIR
jgi:rod shape-determining protein MreD